MNMPINSYFKILKSFKAKCLREFNYCYLKNGSGGGYIPLSPHNYATAYAYVLLQPTYEPLSCLF